MFMFLKTFKDAVLSIFLGLPDKTSNSVTLALLNILPLEAISHKTTLRLLINMLTKQDSVE